MFARPLIAIPTSELSSFLENLLRDEEISDIVVGHPLTMGGTASEQTRIVEEQYKKLGLQFAQVAWHLWDERFSSKQAASMGTRKNKEERLREQARTAAIILRSYLDYYNTSLAGNQSV
jgi:putative transcription antitermination factor YqgF